MINIRRYGSLPVKIAVVHGGPGAPGEMAPVARTFAPDFGVIEPFQTAETIDGQVEELAGLLESEGNIPLIIIGYSWGAWLGGMVTARYPHLVEKLILVSAGPFLEQYATVWQNRMNRLSKEEQQEVQILMDRMDDPACETRDTLLAAFGSFLTRTDSYHPISLVPDPDSLSCNHDIHMRIWEEAADLRRSGRLLNCFQKISCPVVAIHGAYDPHPAEGVREPLFRIIRDFRFILLEKCGHCPWNEVKARDQFYAVLKREVTDCLNLL